MKNTVIYLLFLFPVALWCLLILAAPYLAGAGEERASNLLYLTFSLTCHQLPERSFFILDHKLGVCSRCTGIYFGALTATLLYPLLLKIGNMKTPGKWLLIAAIIPAGMDGGIQMLTAYESNNLLRFITGTVFGIVLPLYLLPVYNEIVYGFLSKNLDI